MQEPITFSFIFSYAILFVTKGIPIIIGLISLFRLLPISGIDDESKLSRIVPNLIIDESKLSRFVPNLIIILACISMVSMSWSSTLSLAFVCVAIIVMNKLKPDNV